MRNKSQRGFTLIEMIVVIVIMAILAVISTNVVQSAFNSYFTNQDIAAANSTGRLVLENMARRIRMIRSSADITTASSTQLVFTDINGNSVNYSWSSPTLQLNSQTLANNVSSFTLSYLDRNASTTSTLANIRYVTVSFTITQNNIAYDFRTTIYARNLP